MCCRLPRPSAAENRLLWQMAAYHRIARCNPETEWKAINRLIDALLPGLDSHSSELPDAREGWARIMEEYAWRREVGERVHPV